MKKQTILSLVAATWLLVGCASSQLAQNKSLPLEIKETKNVSIVRARNYLENENLIVSGAVKRDVLFRSAAYGHVDVLFLDSDGNTIQESNVRYLPVRVPINRSSSLFKETFDEVPEGTEQIVVSYHNQYFYDENHYSN
jgi:hypothetical protein